MIQSIAQVATTIISLYMMIIFIRIVMTWFSGMSYGKAYLFLCSLTDPYLNWFRHNLPVQFGGLDFSAVFGILILGLLNNVLAQIAATGSISVASLLAMVVFMLWGLVRFFFMIFLIIGIVRLVGLVFNLDHRGRFWGSIEQVINPVLGMVVRPFLRGRFTGYRESLMIYCAVLLGGLLAGQVAVSLLITGIRMIPF